jgi:hypothetical protein
MIAIAPFLALACMSCDRSPTAARIEGREYLSSLFECVADVRAGSVVCTEERPSTGGARPALLGQNQIKMASSNVAYDSLTLIYSFNATAQNLLSYPIGTPDGQTKTGLKVYFESGPTATAYNAPYDTGTVTVRNPDGIQSFTKSDQPYFFYDTILRPQQITVAKRWEYTVPRSVARFSFSVRMFTFTPPEKKVPDVAPTGFLIPADSVAKLYAYSNAVWTHPRLSGPYPRNIVEVFFARGATAEERQSAIDMINGTVIGGGTVFYYVLIPTDGTAEPLWKAIDRLQALPQVTRAAPDILTQGTTTLYRRPNEGAGWRKGDWALVPDSAAGANWGPEAVNAPFAWGCETGNDSSRVAVIDAELVHSQWVSSIVAGQANDSSGIAGIMWDGDVTVTYSALAASLRAAFVDSVHVLNLSIGAGYIDSTATANNGYTTLRLPQVGNPADIQRAQATATAYSDRLREHEALFGIQPLYVVAAGNNQVDASYSGIPQLRNDPVLGGRILVVAAASVGSPANINLRRRPLWANSGDPVDRGSNFGQLVDIAAPGAGVQGVANGTASIINGTSFAAPHVTGAAGLLKSFDQRLTAVEIRALLLDGAARGGWTTPSGTNAYPFLNVYEALKAAARRHGAPLCGQRFWVNNGAFIVQRDSASNGTETAFQLGFNGTNPNVLHGGKQVNVFRPNVGQTTFLWTAARGWHAGAVDTRRSDPEGSNATMLSRWPKSHDQDTILDVSRELASTSTIYHLDLVDPDWNLLTRLTTLTVPRDPGVPQCTQEFASVHQASHDSIMTSSDTTTRRVYNDWLQQMSVDPCFARAEGTAFRNPHWWAAYSPRGEAVYFFSGSSVGGATVQGWRTCGQKGRFYASTGGSFEARVYMRCRDWTTNDQSAGTQVYRVDIATGAHTLMSWGSSTAHLEAAGYRENLREMTIESRTWTRTASVSWVQGADDFTWSTRGTASRNDQCTLEFRNPQTGAVHLNAPVACRSGGGDAGFSPSRAHR